MLAKKLLKPQVISNIQTYFNILLTIMAPLIKLFSSLVAIGVLWISTVLAAGIDHFEVSFTPESAQLWESIDIEIQAVDKNNSIVTDYDGTILVFSETDPEVVLPDELNQNTYTFVEADQWVIRFENAIRFQQMGLQDIHVYDLNDDSVFGIGEANIDKKEVLDTLEIDILSPQHNITVGEKSIRVSGTTQKNYQVNIIVNDENRAQTTSNNDGVFEYDVELFEWENTLTAQVLDADSNVIGISQDVKVLVASNLPSFKGITYSPEIVETGSSVDIEVVGSAGLIEANIIMNDIVSSLTETSDWVYTTTIIAPDTAGTYAIDITLKDELQHELNQLAVESIDVIQTEEPILNSGDTEPVEVTTVEIEPTPTEAPDLLVSDLKVVELKSKSILTWSATEWADSYKIYKKATKESNYELVDTIEETHYEVAITWDEIKYDYFAVQAVSQDSEEAQLYEWALSDATKVKTGPEMLLLLLASLFIGWFILITKKRA